MGKHIHVSAAVVKDERARILIARRPAGADMELLWEFPGGKIEPEETPEQALERELVEELNIKAACGETIYKETYEYPDKTVTLYFIEIASYTGKMEPLEHEELLWVYPKDMRKYEFPPADDDFISFLSQP